MIRKIIRIDREACNGCGICAEACHEGAIAMVDGKAELTREDYCDGLGNCLPACPVGAISFEEREAPAYDAKAVEAAMKSKQGQEGGGCPGSQPKAVTRAEEIGGEIEPEGPACRSRLSQWPVQIKLAPVNASWFDGARLLVAADCTAFAYGDFHRKFIQDHVVLIGCPKLDDVDYSEKLTEIIKRNDIKSVTVVRMEVPCCGGMEYAVRRALENSKKTVPWRVAVVSIEGEIIDEL